MCVAVDDKVISAVSGIVLDYGDGAVISLFQKWRGRCKITALFTAVRGTRSMLCTRCINNKVHVSPIKARDTQVRKSRHVREDTAIYRAASSWRLFSTGLCLEEAEGVLRLDHACRISSLSNKRSSCAFDLIHYYMYSLRGYDTTRYDGIQKLLK